jgi:HEAT repeat protein
MRLTIPKLRTWHLLGIVAASAAFIATFQFRWSVEDPGYALVRRLRSADARERTKAARELMSIRPWERRAVAPLTEMLFDPDAGVRAAAARTLNVIVYREDETEIGPVKAALAAVLGDRDPVARLEIATSLCFFDPEPTVIVPTLLELLARSKDSPTQVKVILCLRHYTRRSEPALDALVALLGDAHADPEVRMWAAESLGYGAVSPTLAPQPLLGRIKAALNEAADDKELHVRATAVNGLGSLAALSRIDEPRVIQALDDPISLVRSNAAAALRWNRPGKRSQDLLPALVRALSDADVQVRRASAGTLGDLGIEAEAALPALRASTNDPEESVRYAATDAVEAIEKAARTLREITLPGAIAELGDADPIVRALAASRLEVLGPRASEAIPALVVCLSDPEAEVRRASAVALSQLGPGAAVAGPSLAKLAESDPDERVRRAATFSRSILLGEGVDDRVP